MAKIRGWKKVTESRYGAKWVSKKRTMTIGILADGDWKVDASPYWGSIDAKPITATVNTKAEAKRIAVSAMRRHPRG